MGAFFVWLLLCSDQKLSVNCSIVKLTNRMEWAQCWSKAAEKQDLLINSDIRHYKLWCSNRDYIKELESERHI